MEEKKRGLWGLWMCEERRRRRRRRKDGGGLVMNGDGGRVLHC